MAASKRRKQGGQRLLHGLAPLRTDNFFRFLCRTCDIRRPNHDLARRSRGLRGSSSFKVTVWR